MVEQTEQTNRVVEQILRIIATDVHAKWIRKLSFIEFTINSLVNVSIGNTPFEQVQGKQVRNVVDQLDGLHWIKGAQQMVVNILKLVEESKTKLLQA